MATWLTAARNAARAALTFGAVLLVLAAFSAPARAENGGNYTNDNPNAHIDHNINTPHDDNGAGDDKSGSSCDGGSVPEIDPNSMAGALTLLIGGVLVAADRFRRK